MELSAILQTYLITLAVCISITLIIISSIKPGLKRFFDNLSQDQDISTFFVKLTNIIIFLGGVGAAIGSVYTISEEGNWLTLTWSVANQMEKSLSRLFITLIVFAVVFFVLHLRDKQSKK